MGGKAINWSLADWTKSDMRIAFKLGCARSTVVQKRKQLGKVKVKSNI